MSRRAVCPAVSFCGVAGEACVLRRRRFDAGARSAQWLRKKGVEEVRCQAMRFDGATRAADHMRERKASGRGEEELGVGEAEVVGACDLIVPALGGQIAE